MRSVLGGIGRGIRTRSKQIVPTVVSFCVLLLVLFLLLSALFPLPPGRPYSLVVEDRNGLFLHAYLADDGVWRMRTSPDEIPDRLKRILIRREDRWFYFHPGVNPFSLIRAVVQNIRHGRRVSGASTITMQIARMLEPKERTYLHKAMEIFRALQLEWRYTKDELLGMYLSMVPMGGNLEGLKSASMLYYETPPERLNIAQLFDLILIPNNPSGRGPDKNPEQLFDERKRQAISWIRQGLLSEQDSAIIWNTPSATGRKALPRLAPHFCLRIKEKSKGGGSIRSTLDLGIQKTVERLLTSHLRPWKLKGVQNGAVLVVDNRTKGILAYVGSENFDEADSRGQVDAVKALRSPGSTLKPLLYALQMERGELTPRTRLLDTPYDAEGFLAENYDGTYSGWVYADDALRRSLNVPMIRILKRAGVSRLVDFLRSCGFASLAAQRPKLGLSLILGGCGVTLEELTGAYAAFPSSGSYSPLVFSADQELRAVPSVNVFSPSTAYMVTEILSGLDRPDLPNNFASSFNLPLVAFKTGTSYGRRDAWSIGYSSEFTVGVWAGNVNHQGNPELVGSKAAAPLLFDILDAIATQHGKGILPVPRDVGLRSVCANSGLPPSSRCTHLIEDYYSITQTVQRVCDVCREYMVSEDGRISFCTSCLGDNRYKVLTFIDYPPELLSYWQMTGEHVTAAPPHNHRCVRVFAGNGPSIVTPSTDMTYYLFSKNQRLALQASSGVDVLEHIWYLNDEYLGRRKVGEKLFVTVREGENTVTCMDDRGRASTVRMRVRYVM